MREFSIDWIEGDDFANVTTPSGSALKNKLMRYAKERPDEVKLIVLNTNGSAVFHIPVSYVKVGPKRSVSEEQRQAMGERSKRMWEEKRQNSSI